MSAIVAAATTRALAWTLPALSGELRGELTPTLFPGAPALQWEIVAQRTTGTTRHVVIAAQGNGARVRAEADFDVRTGGGSWVLHDAVLDGRFWFAPFFQWLGGAVAGIVGGGELRLQGRGTFRGGMPAGNVAVTFRRGNLRSAEGKWTLDGISLDGEFAIDGRERTVQSASPVKIFVQTISTSRYGARNFSIEGRLTDLRSLRVETAHIEIAGGDAVASPCIVSLIPFEIQVDVAFKRVGLQDIAALVPGLLSDARGRVDGRAHVGWTPGGGLQLGDAAISANNDEPTEIRLAPFPGLITDYVPQSVREKVLQQYPGLGLIETGKVPLRSTLLEAVYTPKGDASGRTAYVHLMGGPVDPKLRAPVDLEINVRGPIQPLIKFGTDPRLHFGAQ